MRRLGATCGLPSYAGCGACEQHATSPCRTARHMPRSRLLPLSPRPHTQHQSLSLRHPGAARTGSVAGTTSPCSRHGVERWRVGLPAGPPADLCGWRSACQADGHRGVAATRGVTRWPAGRLPWWTSVAGTARAGDKAHARAWRDWRGLACRVVATRPGECSRLERRQENEASHSNRGMLYG